MEQTHQIYTCPMHPEIVSDAPGRCPKCGMALVLKSDTTQMMHPKIEDNGLGKITLKSYMPLFVIVGLLVVASVVSNSREGVFTLQNILLSFMSGFFIVFGAFKIMDLKGFADGYSTYDLIAQKWYGYGYVYPFIELLFGFVMLAGYHPAWLLWTEAILMIVSGFGVAIKIAKKEEFMCACLGTFLKVPLTYVTLIEDFGMAFIAILLLFII